MTDQPIDEGQRKRAIIDAQIAFDRVLVAIFSTHVARLAKQLTNSGVMDFCHKMIRKRFGRFERSTMRKFIAGEMTGGVPPISVPRMYARQVEEMLTVCDVIETIAHEQCKNSCRHTWEPVEGSTTGEIVCSRCFARTDEPGALDKRPPKEVQRASARNKRRATKTKPKAAAPVANKGAADGHHPKPADPSS